MSVAVPQQKVRPFYWYHENLAEALEQYESIFKDLFKLFDKSARPDGSLSSAEFEIGGSRMFAMSLPGMPESFFFNDSISMFVSCEDQAEVDYYWDAFLKRGGEVQACGWLKDKFGLRWQIIPKQLMTLMADKDPEVAGYAHSQMLQMKKIIIADLTRQ